jgi:hypothetical protein
MALRRPRGICTAITVGTGADVGRGCAVSLPDPMTLYAAYGRELAELLEQVLAGDLVADRAVAERLVRSLEALVWLQQRHRVDEHGRCLLPRTWWWPWPKRTTCTVHSALGLYLGQPDRFVPAENQAHVRGMS